MAGRARAAHTTQATESTARLHHSPPHARGLFAAAMACCLRMASLLLTYTSVLLAMFAGAALVTAARFKWDPSTYVLVRELFPVEYRVMAGMLVSAGCVLLLLAHLAIVAVNTKSPRARRVLLILYALLMGALVCGEVAWCAWTAQRINAWLHTPSADTMLEMLQLRKNVAPILDFMGHFFTLPQKIKDLMEEAEADIPRNIYAVAVGATLLALLQSLALGLAIVLALNGPARASRNRRLSASWATTTTSLTGVTSEKAPLRTAYKNGRIVIL